MSETPATSAALHGVVVIDLGQIYNAPYATMLMALAGADVIKVEPPEGERLRRRPSGAELPYGFRVLNANKRSVTLDLKHPRGRTLLLELIEKADVLVENFRPGVMERLGLGVAEIQERNPSIIVASSSGYGSTGPDRNLAALDLTVQAMSGVMSATGFPDGPPVKSGAAVADFMGGIHLYAAVVTALYRRAVTGVAGVVEVAMIDAILPTLLSSFSSVVRSGASAPERTGNRDASLAVAPYNVYATADGYVAVISLSERHWHGIADAMGRPDLQTDERFARSSARGRNMQAVDEVLQTWTRSLATSEVFEQLRRRGVPCSPVRSVNEVMNDQQLRDRGMIDDFGPDGGPTVPLLHSPLRFVGEERTPLAPPPELGEHSRAVLGGLLGYSDDDLSKLRADGIT